MKKALLKKFYEENEFLKLEFAFKPTQDYIRKHFDEIVIKKHWVDKFEKEIVEKYQGKVNSDNEMEESIEVQENN